MTYPLVGALVGLAFAAAEYVLFGVLVAKAAREGTAGQGPRVLDIVRKVQLAIYPVVGWFAGSFLANSTGAP